MKFAIGFIAGVLIVLAATVGAQSRIVPEPGICPLYVRNSINAALPPSGYLIREAINTDTQIVTCRYQLSIRQPR